MSNDNATADEVARMAADLVTTYMHPDSVIALSNGRGVASVVHAMTPIRRPGATVVQAIGGTAKGNLLLDSPELCRQLAERIGCAYRVMPAPVLVSNPQAAAALKAEESVGMTIAMASHADILVTGVGAVGMHSVAPIFDHVMSERAHAELLSRGAVGHICGHHVDSRGRHIDADFCQGLMAVPLDRIPSITHVIVSAFGSEKVPALTAILRGKWVTDLVTDIATARAVLGHLD
jgi:DNA-binding transcriptional regulator LsrR (DeoR family)